jgi:two-component system sensor histidine kinase KdpD
VVELSRRVARAGVRVVPAVDSLLGLAMVRVGLRREAVAAEAHEQIFEPFNRGGRSTGPGAGLGLAIARGFAEANGGRLWVESLSGQGAAFVLSLPSVREAVPA